MNTSIRHKLRDERGATILMALFAFMVAAMVAAVILAAATTSLRQVKQDQQNQQDLLVLQSVGKLIEKEVLGTTVKVADTTSYENNVPKETTRSVTTSSTGLFASQIRDAVEAIYPLGSEPASDYMSGTSKVTISEGDFSQEVEISFVYKQPASATTGADSDRVEHLIFTLSTKGSNNGILHSLVVDFPEPSSVTSAPDDKKATDKKGNEVLVSRISTSSYSWKAPTYKRVGGDE